MKVLMINTVCGITSTGRICTDIADILTERGGECKVAHGRGVVPEKDKKYSVKIGNDFDVKVHGLGTRIFDNTGFYSVKATKDFLKWVEEYDPDIIHLHNIHGYYINIKLLFEYLKKSGKPIVWTLHDCWAFTGHCAHYTFAGCGKWKTGCSKCPIKKEYPSSFVIDNSKRNYKIKKDLFGGLKDLYLVTPSEWLKNEVKQSFLKEYPVKVFNNGINLETFKPIKNKFRQQYNLENKFILLGVANIWSKRKGIDDFINLSTVLDKKYQIVLVGDIRDVKLPDNIIHIPHTNNIQELAEIYADADVFVNPTYEDNFPTTNLESLACGTPVITYKVGGSPEAIDENNGCIVPVGDINAIVSAIETLKADSKCCVENAKRFDKEKCFDKYIELYKEILK